MRPVANSDVIGDVSTALERLLTDAMANLAVAPAAAPIAKVHDLRGNTPTAPPLLTLFLYEICEDGHSRNRPPLREPDPAGYVIRKPPMALLTSARWQ